VGGPGLPPRARAGAERAGRVPLCLARPALTCYVVVAGSVLVPNDWVQAHLALRFMFVAVVGLPYLGAVVVVGARDVEAKRWRAPLARERDRVDLVDVAAMGRSLTAEVPERLQRRCRPGIVAQTAAERRLGCLTDRIVWVDHLWPSSRANDAARGQA
jgi:hypothetical protein